MGLNESQLSNLKRFQKKLPDGSTPTITRQLPNGSVSYQSFMPGKVPGSFAVYEKQVSSTGETLQYAKTTFGPNGNIIHDKEKIRDFVDQH
ncbi:MAG: hypothetical protein H6625_04390 [Bdellovibrionaceae bacterium]|nr:hypothetical protein [Pseudobdellovibrionaceae bacterium]